MSHDHHNLHNHRPLSSGQGWTGCGGATGGFSKKSARRKGFFSSQIDFIFLLMQIQIFSACANFREQHQSNHHHSHDHHYHSHQHHPNDVDRYIRAIIIIPTIIATKAISTLMTSLGTTGETLQLSCLQLCRRRTYSPWST